MKIPTDIQWFKTRVKGEEGKEELKRKHGSPRSFAQACNNAIGTISCLEAHTAIAEYKAKWDAA